MGWVESSFVSTEVSMEAPRNKVSHALNICGSRETSLASICCANLLLPEWGLCWDCACSAKDEFEVQARQQMFLFLPPTLQQPQTLFAEPVCSFD